MTTTAPTALFGTVATRAANLPVPTNVKDPKVSTAIAQLVTNSSLVKVSEQQVVLFGTEKQKASATVLDGILTEVTKGNSPVLFELFKQLSKGVEEADLPALETSIRDSLNKRWWHSILDTLKLSSVAKRLEKANDRIGSLLTTKSANLLTLTGSMEKQIGEQVNQLITDGQRLNKLAQQFRNDIGEFTILVEAGRQILVDGEAESKRRGAEATQSQDPLQIEDAKRFEQKVELFRSRLMALETVLARAPVELESIRHTQGAALTTLAEVSTGALGEFNIIKSTLIKLATVHSVQSTQSLNEQRRALVSKLEGHSNQMLSETAVKAARALGQNRLDDATKLVEFAGKIDAISKAVDEERRQNVTRYAEARTKLGEVKVLMNQGIIDI